MDLLLHICCAPCMIYPLERLRERGFEVTGFFYNPNIHPLEEYNKRKEAVEGLSKELALEVIYPEYHPEEFLRPISSNEIAPGRCAICWELRMARTVQEAKIKDFPYFSTTLLVSPYQDQELLCGIGGHLEEEENVNFYYEDFRPGFRRAHDEAKSKKIYCQKYCGCLYSEKERCRKSEKH